MGHAYLSDYLHSFRPTKRVFLTLSIDALYCLIVGLLFALVSARLYRTLVLLTGGRTAEQFQQYFYTLSQEQLLAFYAQLQSAIFLIILFLIILPLIAFILYGLSNSLVWHLIEGKEFVFRKHWKWNLMHFVLIVIGIVLLVMYRIVRKALTYIWPFFGASVSNIIFFVLVLLFLSVSFLFFYHFLNTHKVGQSLTLAFDTLRQKFGNVPKVAYSVGASIIFLLFLQYLLAPFGNSLLAFVVNLALATPFFFFISYYTRSSIFSVIILSGLTYYVLRALILYPFRFQFIIYPTAGTIVSIAIFLLWLAWFRAYFVGSILKGELI